MKLVVSILILFHCCTSMSLQSVFDCFGKVFRNNFFHFFSHAFVCKSCGELVEVYFKEAIALSFIDIKVVFGSDQCFVGFGTVFGNNCFHLSSRCPVCRRSCAHFIAVHIREATACCTLFYCNPISI